MWILGATLLRFSFGNAMEKLDEASEDEEELGARSQGLGWIPNPEPRTLKYKQV